MWATADSALRASSAISSYSTRARRTVKYPECYPCIPVNTRFLLYFSPAEPNGIDVCGGGYVVAPPSTPNVNYNHNYFFLCAIWLAAAAGSFLRYLDRGPKELFLRGAKTIFKIKTLPKKSKKLSQKDSVSLLLWIITITFIEDINCYHYNWLQICNLYLYWLQEVVAGLVSQS
jgi:hypothetical protein